MAHLLPAPPLADADRALLSAAGDLRATVACALWPDLAGVLAAVAANPKALARVPAEWVPQVVACLPPAAAAAATQADRRRCASEAFDRFHRPQPAVGRWHAGSPTPASRRGPAGSRLPSAPIPIPSPGEVARLVADAADAAAPPTSEEAERLAAHLQASPVIDPAMPQALVRLWVRPDWVDEEDRRTVGLALHPWLSAMLLVANRRWRAGDRAVLYSLSRVVGGVLWRDNDATLWQVVGAGPPEVDVADAARLAAEASGGRLTESFAFQLVGIAAGVAPDFSATSRWGWAEHVGAMLSWASSLGGDVRRRTLDAHQAWVASSLTAGRKVDSPRDIPRFLAAFEEMAGDAEARVALALHCTAPDTIELWLDVATPAERDAWLALRAHRCPFSPDTLDLLLRDSSPLGRGEVVGLVRSSPGLVWQMRHRHVRDDLLRLVVGLLADALGNDPARWRTAFEVVGDDVSVDDVVGAVAAVHGPRP
jgi:hypothetical protein